MPGWRNHERDGSDGYFTDRGCTLMVHSFEIHQKKDLPLVFRQPRNRAIQFPQLA